MHARAVHPGASKRRQQCRMHVHDSTSMSRHDLGGHQTQVTGQRDEIDVVVAQHRVERLATRTCRRFDHRRR
jgi:hypothetical protein